MNDVCSFLNMWKNNRNSSNTIGFFQQKIMDHVEGKGCFFLKKDQI